MTSSSPDLQLILTGDSSYGRIRVNLESFFAYSFDLAEQLQALESDWASFAMPGDVDAVSLADVLRQGSGGRRS